MAENPSAKGSYALVTGGNKGIGFEIGRGLAAAGAVVFLGCRSEQLGNAAADQLRAEGGDVRPIALDVTSDATIHAAASRIAAEAGRLDILVNNAGIALEEMDAKPSTIPASTIRRVYDVNVFGVIAVTQAILPLLAKSERGRIVNVSSSLGSIALATRNGPAVTQRAEAAFWPTLLAYNSSKTALNSITMQFANELRGTTIKVNSACPGYCATDLNGHSGPRTASQGAQTPVRLAMLPDDGPTGGFFNDDGVVPW